MKKFNLNNTHTDEDETPCHICDSPLTEEHSSDDSKTCFTDADYLEYFKNHKKGFCIGLISIFAIILVSILLFIAGSFISTVCKYNKAEDALNNSSYDEAIELYESITNYKDSDEKLHEAKYRKADALVQDREYDEAITLYRDLAVYKDSADKINDVTYQKGKHLLEQNLFVDAISIFTNLGDYKDSKDVLKEASYQYAYQLVEKSQFLDAIEIFNSLGEYKESKSMITECNYRQGSVYISNKEYEKAINLYESLGNYKDSKTQKKEALYQKALSNIEQRNNENAYKTLVSLGDYKDAKKLLNNFQYMIVSKEETDFKLNETEKWLYHYDVNGDFSYMNVDGNESRKETTYDGNPEIETGSPGRHYTGSYNNPDSVSYYDKNGYLTDYAVFNDDGSVYFWGKREYSNGLLVRSEGGFGDSSWSSYVDNGPGISLYSYDLNGRITECKKYHTSDKDGTTTLTSQTKYNYGYIYVKPQ